MAEIERTEHGDEGRAREWMARALNAAPDPVWTADGIVSERWLPMSPASGRLDAFEWKTPLAELPAPADIGEPAAPVIEPEQPPRAPSDDATPAAAQAQEQAAEEKEQGVPLAAAPPRRQHRDGLFAPQSTPAADIVVPVVPAPDDPGPDPEPDGEPATRCPGFGLACVVPLGCRRVLANSGRARYQEREIRRNSSVGRAHHS